MFIELKLDSVQQMQPHCILTAVHHILFPDYSDDISWGNVLVMKLNARNLNGPKKFSFLKQCIMYLTLLVENAIQACLHECVYDTEMIWR